LLEIGHSQRRAVLIMWMWAALLSFGTVLASLYSGVVVWVSLGVMTLLTVVLTFLLPVLHRPRLPGHEDPVEPAEQRLRGPDFDPRRTLCYFSQAQPKLPTRFLDRTAASS
jgi:UDP-GlcNAc:undecaprenyl-phosphate GlcNAc-1-phosphate transferase